jgi:hypothetical protein
LDNRPINLGPNEAEAYRRWHLLMTGADEAFIDELIQTAKPVDKAQAATVRQLVKSCLGWQDGHAKLAAHTRQLSTPT